MVIDLFGLSPNKCATAFPEVYQWVSDRVKPEARSESDARAYSENLVDLRQSRARNFDPR